MTTAAVAPTVSTSSNQAAAAPAPQGSGLSVLNRPTKAQVAQHRANANAMAKRKMNENSPELQALLEQYVDNFCANITHIDPVSRVRHDYPRNGMLAEIMRRTPVRVYDLPELKARVNTAFVDTTNRMYMSDTFFRKLHQEVLDGHDSVDFLLKHEMEHLRRVHLQRMMDFHPHLSNVAQDIRINIDIVISTVAANMLDAGQDPNNNAVFDKAVTAYYSNMGESIKSGCGTTRADYDKYGKMSEEAIAAELLKEWKNKPQNPEQAFSFNKLCDGVALDLDAVHGKTADPVLATLSQTLTADVRKIGAAKGRAKPAEIQSVMQGLETILKTVEITDLDVRHDSMQPTNGNKVASVATGDPYVDTQRPSVRIHILHQILDQIMNPTADGPAMGGSGKIKVKDLELPGNGQQGTPSSEPGGQGKPGDPSPGGPADNIYYGDEHVMSAAELAEILKEAGCHDAVAKLGYDDLEKIAQEEEAGKNGVMAAINQASEDKMKLGGAYAGGHLVDYANSQITDFYKPVISWKSAFKALIDDTGRASRFDQGEPWMIYHADHNDMGMASANDIPYMGSFVPGAEQRPLVIAMVDDSGSVGDKMLLGFVSESLNMVRETDQGESSPEVILLFCDSEVRGEPQEINEDNLQQLLREGIVAGGRGGTNFTAAMQQAFAMFEEGGRFEGRTFDAMVYFTDTYDAPPKQDVIELAAEKAGFSQLPPMLFLAPKKCFNDAFAKAVAPYADTIFFDESEMTVDFENVEANIDSRGQRKTLSFF